MRFSVIAAVFMFFLLSPAFAGPSCCPRPKARVEAPVQVEERNCSDEQKTDCTKKENSCSRKDRKNCNRSSESCGKRS